MSSGTESRTLMAVIGLRRLSLPNETRSSTARRCTASVSRRELGLWGVPWGGYIDPAVCGALGSRSTRGPGSRRNSSGRSGAGGEAESVAWVATEGGRYTATHYPDVARAEEMVNTLIGAGLTENESVMLERSSKSPQTRRRRRSGRRPLPWGLPR
jgi:hypothetical protein